MTLLAPSARVLMSSILSPPTGMRLDRAIATTYSLDLETLLPIPVTMALSDTADPDEVRQNPVALLQAIEDTAGRFAVFAQEGGIKAGNQVPQLCSLLEDCVHEVRAPNGGAFHAKVWLLRFKASKRIDRGDKRQTLLRLVVMSRNLTDDRSWDISLAIDGEVGEEPRQDNADVAQFVRRLPSMTTGDGRKRDLSWLGQLAEDAERAQWETPPGFHRVRFKHFGLGGPTWRMPRGDALVAISPFVSDRALRDLKERGHDAVHLVSRSQELAELSDNSLEGLASCKVLESAAQSDDGEEIPSAANRQAVSPLHAKVYAIDRGQTLHLMVGSANATTLALITGHNVEFMAHLTGTAAATGTAVSMLDPDSRQNGFGALLMDFDPDLARQDLDTERRKLEQRLEDVRDRIIAAQPYLTCAISGGAGEGSDAEEPARLFLGFRRSLDLAGVEARAWPATLKKDDARLLSDGHDGRDLELAPTPKSSLTRFLSIELSIPDAQKRDDTPTLPFCLQVPVEGLPDDRKALIFRAIISDRRRFLEYLRLLLGDLGLNELIEASGSQEGWWAFADDASEAPLLEQMLRARAHDPRRLRAIRDVIDQLHRTGAPDVAAAVVPEDFLRIWHAFEER